MKNRTMQHLLSGSSVQNIVALLIANQLAVSFIFIRRLVYVLFTAVLLIPFQLLEIILFTNRIKNTKITHDPIFIIGHFRSGTTFLHNILSKDIQFGFPTTYQSFLPGAFLTGNVFLKSIHKKTLPLTRPMDAVKMHPDFPQEEEFALSALSTLSYYQSIFFPTNMIDHFNAFALLNTPHLGKWKSCYINFIKKITYYNNGKRLILKNPVNTTRIEALITIFPNAKFIYLKRNPNDVLQSTYKLYTELLKINSFQNISEVALKKNIQWMFYETIEHYQKQKNTLSQSQLIEVNYEDLIKKPYEEIKKIYLKLGINGLELSEININKYIGRESFLNNANNGSEDH